MIVYFDTSALVAMYVLDHFTDRAERSRDEASSVATSFLAYAEALAAFSAAARGRTLPARERARVEAQFLVDWSEFHRIRLDARITPDVRRVLSRHHLKGADAIHLATALFTARGCAASGIEYRFACGDRTLAAAAIAEGLVPAW